jgi:hypothetical protein
MDRDAILQTLPSGRELRAAPPYRQKEAAENLYATCWTRLT